MQNEKLIINITFNKGMRKTLKISKPSRPHIPEYGISEGVEGLVDWNTVNLWLEESKNYWISTTRPDSKPHARPIWGIWLDNFFYFGGGSKTITSKNLILNNDTIIHTESGENVVIIEGYAEKFIDENLEKILGQKYEARYSNFHPPPFWRVVPKIVYCWKMADYTTSPTKFICSLD